MNRIISLFLMAGVFGISGMAQADSPCKDKIEAKHTARKAVHECLMAWGRDVKPGDPDPADDCAAKVSAFVSASKEFKSCRVENQKTKKKSD